MAASSSSHGRTREALLEESDINGRENRKWWKKVLDMEEAKHQLLFSLPMILTNLFYYLITLVSVMLVGHLGDLQLAGATLANSWFSVTGVALMVLHSFTFFFFSMSSSNLPNKYFFHRTTNLTVSNINVSKFWITNNLSDELFSGKSVKFMLSCRG